MSSWKLVQEVNGDINRQNHSIRAIKSFIEQYNTAINDDDFEAENINHLLTHATQMCDAMLKINRESYLDSGYQYDDQDPRNIMDLFDDNWESRSTARCGSSMEDEMRSQIATAVTKNHFYTMLAKLRMVPGFGEFWQEYIEQCNEEAEFEFDVD